jgi:hypothetical protein
MNAFADFVKFFVGGLYPSMFTLDTDVRSVTVIIDSAKSAILATPGSPIPYYPPAGFVTGAFLGLGTFLCFGFIIVCLGGCLFLFVCCRSYGC